MINFKQFHLIFELIFLNGHLDHLINYFPNYLTNIKSYFIKKGSITFLPHYYSNYNFNFKNLKALSLKNLYFNVIYYIFDHVHFHFIN